MTGDINKKSLTKPIDFDRIDTCQVEQTITEHLRVFSYSDLFELADTERQSGARDLLVDAFNHAGPGSPERSWVIEMVGRFESRLWNFYYPHRKWLHEIVDDGKSIGLRAVLKNANK